MKAWKTPFGSANIFHAELLNQKHLLIAGASGSGKSVLLNGLMYNALYRAPVDADGGVQFILIDLKGMELVLYKHLPHTLCYASEPDEAVKALVQAIDVMTARNKYSASCGLKIYPGGDLYVIIDEFADLMTTRKKQVVPLIQRLAQVGRAARIHIILCTQCPLVKIIPTEIKVNFDAVVGLHVSCKQHSRNILEVNGCEELRIGECLYTLPDCKGVRRAVNIPLFSDDVLRERVKWWTSQTPRGLFRLRRIR